MLVLATLCVEGVGAVFAGEACACDGAGATGAAGGAEVEKSLDSKSSAADSSKDGCE